MSTWQKKVAAHLDGHAAGDAPSTPEARAYADELLRLREGVQAVKSTPEISDAQFAAFMSGIREGIDAAPARHRGLWAAFSLVAAALVVALSLFVILETDNIVNPPVAGAEPPSVVESASSEIFSVDYYTSDEGDAVVNVNSRQSGQVDMWE